MSGIDRTELARFIDSAVSLTQHREETPLLDGFVDVMTAFIQPAVILLAEAVRVARNNEIEIATSVIASTGGGGGNDLTNSAMQASLARFGSLAEMALERQAIQQSSVGQEAIVFPICQNQKIDYLLFIESHKISSGDREFIQGLICLLENHLALLSDSNHDTLTGLLNRKMFLEKIRRTLALSSLNSRLLIGKSAPQLERRETQTGEFWLGLFDIDHFKRVNDTYGHVYGDEVLILMSNLMRETFRLGDHLFRYGGEEFLVLIGSVNKEIAMRVFNRLRHNVESHQFGKLDQLTISVGMCEIRLDDEPSTIVGKADQAMYHAKANGRNQLAVFEDLLATGVVNPPEINCDIEIF